MSQTEKPTAASIVSLAGGLLVLVGGVVSFLWTYYSGWMWWRGMMMWWWMPWWIPPLWLVASAIGVISGAVIIVGALAILYNPLQSQLWGALILVFSVIGLFGSGGFIAGSLLGIMGGILALSWKTQPKGV